MSEDKPAGTLLIVDDDRGLLRLAAKALEREGFVVATATTGAEAVAWLKTSRPDLLLLDLKLQDCDARQVIRQLSDLQCLPPFLIITGQGDERVAVEMMKGGARDYLVKGADFLELLPAVAGRVLAADRAGRQTGRGRSRPAIERGAIPRGPEKLADHGLQPGHRPALYLGSQPVGACSWTGRCWARPTASCLAARRRTG
jgi:DNA-binding NtrC family response regulator